MPYYHTYVDYTDKKGKSEAIFGFNQSEKRVRQGIANPYMENEAFLLVGRAIHPSEIDDIAIFVSEEGCQKLVLPNGKSPLVENNNRYIANCFGTKKVKGVSVCTYKFITSPPKEKGKSKKPLVKLAGKGKKVFIVHGRDEKPALQLQKYLTKTLKIDAEMFEDFKKKSGSNTIIEQLEYIKDNVGYAFVIVTPDDLGCLRENIDKCRTKMLVGKRSVSVKSVCEILDNLQKRTRQNVVFEFGLFIGALGRDNVFCLVQKDTQEKPSDIDGILYVKFDKSVKETFTEITEKLKNVGLVKN